MKRTIKKRVWAAVMAAGIAALYICNVAEASQVMLEMSDGRQTETMQEELSENEFVEAIVVESESVISNGSISVYSNNVMVKGDGVRLRKNPSTTATVLELMQSGERVVVDLTKSKPQNGKWYYVRRKSTGTRGWVKGSYLAGI